MNLTLYFRLICMTLFDKRLGALKSIYNENEKGNYSNVYFYCPRVFAKDGFNVSLQIHNGNYCSSENGYRELGHTWETVEFGYPSEADEAFKEYAEDERDICATVGRIPVSVLEQIFENHGGIDWEKTFSVETFNKTIS